MKCHRCGSVMVYERFYGPVETFQDGDASRAEKLLMR